MSLYIVPYLWYLIIPLTVFITVIQAVFGMTSNREIIVMYSLGITKKQIAKPFIFFVFIIITLHYFISTYIMADFYHQFRTLQLEARKEYGLALLSEQTFATQIQGLTIYIGKKNGPDSLEHIFVDDNRDPRKQITMTATKGKISQNELGEIILFLQNGSYQEYHQKDQSNPILTFAQYQLTLPIESGQEKERRIDVHEQSTIAMLFSDNPKAKAYGHQRLVWPLYSLITTLVILRIFLASNTLSRTQRNSRIFYSLSLCLLLIALSFLLQGLAIKLSVIIILMYIVPILSLIIALTKLIYNE